MNHSIMEVLSIEWLTGLSIIVLTIHYYLTKNFDYWRKRKLPGPKPFPLFGTFKNVYFGRISITDYTKSVYDSYRNEPAIGLFFNSTPTLLIKDPKMIKDVLIKSFLTFPNRGVTIHPDIEPLAQHLLFLEYKQWKPLRSKLISTFASGKLKEMFYSINECADRFANYLNDLVPKEKIIECRYLSAKFTTDVIGVCAFGLKMNALEDENSVFYKIGEDIFANSFFTKLRLLSRLLPSWIVVILKPLLRDTKTISFFIHTIQFTMDYRKKNNIRRNDFIDLLMDIREHPNHGEGYSDVMLAAQAFVFFAAGFETSATTISNAMYELAFNPNIQDKLREEIQVTIKATNGKLSYDAIQNMKYLDKVIQETLRKHPPATVIPREAVSDHTFSDSKISITKATKILIPVYAIHHDPDIYPNPDKFDPERFDKEAVKLRPSMTYLPFGDGPRVCIGKRFADNETKLGLITIIRNWRLEVCDKTCKQYVKRPGFCLLAPKNGLFLRFRRL